MARPSKRDQAAEIVSKYRHLRSEGHDERLSKYDRMDKLLLGEHWEKKRKYKLALRIHHTTLSIAHGILVKQPIRYHVVPRETIEDKSDAISSSTVERFSQGLLEVSSYRAGEDLHAKLWYFILLYGCGIPWLTWDLNLEEHPDDWGYLPLRLDIISPKNFLWELGGAPQGRFPGVMFFDERVYEDVKYEWPDARLRDEIPTPAGESRFTKRPSKSMYVDYWWYEGADSKGRPKVWNAVVWGEQLVKEPTHMEKYRLLPGQPIGCYDTYGLNPANRFLSFLFPIEDNVHDLERAVSNLTLAVAKFAQPTKVIDQAGAEPVVADDEPGGTIILNSSGEAKQVVSLLEPRDMSPGARYLIDYLQRHVGMSAFPLGPLRAGQPESGVALGIMTEDSRIPLDPPLKHWQLGWNYMLQHATHLAAAYAPSRELHLFPKGDQRSFSARGRDLTNWQIQVSITPEIPSEAFRKTAAATQHIQQGLPLEWVLEHDYGIEQPEDVLDMKVAEEVRQHDAFKKFMTRRVMERLLIQEGATPEEIAQVLEEAFPPAPLPPGRGTPARPELAPAQVASAAAQGQVPPEQLAGLSTQDAQGMDILQQLMQGMVPQAPGVTPNGNLPGLPQGQ